MMVNIESKGTGTETELFWEDGKRIRGVSGIDLQIRADDMNKATLYFCIPSVKAFAECRMSDEHLAELAEAHGFKLERITQ